MDVLTSFLLSKAVGFGKGVLENLVANLLSDSLKQLFCKDTAIIRRNTETILNLQEGVMHEISSLHSETNWNFLVSQTQSHLNVISYYYESMGKLEQQSDASSIQKYCQDILKTDTNSIQYAIYNLDAMICGSGLTGKPLVAAYGEAVWRKGDAGPYMRATRMWRQLLAYEMVGYSMMLSAATYLEANEQFDQILRDMVLRINRQMHITRNSIGHLPSIIRSVSATGPQKCENVRLIDTRMVTTDPNHLVMGARVIVRNVRVKKWFGFETTRPVYSLSILQAELDSNGEVKSGTLNWKQLPEASCDEIEEVDSMVIEPMSLNLTKFVSGIGFHIFKNYGQKFVRLRVQFTEVSPDFRIIEFERQVPADTSFDRRLIRSSISPVIDLTACTTEPYCCPVNGIGFYIDSKDPVAKIQLQFNTWVDSYLSEQSLRDKIQNCVQIFKPAASITATPDPPNIPNIDGVKRILVFGSCGSGKTSMISTLSHVNTTISDYPSIFQMTKTQIRRENTVFEFVEVAGIDCSNKDLDPKFAMCQLISLISQFKQGFHIAIYVQKATRISENDEPNFSFFSSIIKDRIPIIAVITNCENEDHMQNWIDANTKIFERSNMRFSGMIGTCFAKGGPMEPIYNQKRLESEVTVWKALSGMRMSRAYELKDTVKVLRYSWNSLINYMTSVVGFKESKNWKWKSQTTLPAMLQKLTFGKNDISLIMQQL